MSRRSTKAWIAAPLLAACQLVTAAVAPVGVNVLPGPAALNDPAPRAPQLENVGIWTATPIMISGASAYRAGEFLYQDFLYDDRGATTNGASGATNLSRSGRYSYPTNVAAYFENAADFVEVRLKLTGSETAFRLTYNSMSDPALVGATIALGGSSGVLRSIPFGANAAEPADVFVTVHGTTAVATDAVSGAVLASGLPVTADVVRRQIEVRLPFGVYDPRGQTAVRVAAATGLWDVPNNRYLIPIATATSTQPGGAGTNVPNPPAFFNVAFRFNEPDPGLTAFTRWRDGVQGSTLAATTTLGGVQTHDLSRFSATVDFVKLAAGGNDDLIGQTGGVPQTGFIDRIYSSRYEVQQGVGNPAAPNLMKSQGCSATGTVAANGTTSCIPQFAGRLEPYAVYVPAKVPPASGYGITTDLHGAGDNYNRNPPVTVERTISLAERGTGSIVYITEGRGTQYWWWGQAGSEIWEVMADIKRHYPIDAEQIIASGISQGGYSTWKQTTMFPDLYAAAVPHVPCPSAGTGYNNANAPGGTDSFAYPMIDSLRNVPVIASAGEGDTTCAWTGAFGNQSIRAKLDALGYQYEFWSFLQPGHIFAMPACTRVANDTPVAVPSGPPCGYSFEADYLDRLVGVGNPVKRVTNPPRVTYSVNAGWQEPAFGLVGDHAYWLSGVTVRDTTTTPYGKVDAFTHGLGLTDRTPNATQITSGSDYTLGSTTFLHTYNKWSKTLNAATATAATDSIDIVATNISKVVIDPIRANLSCNASVNVTSDGPISVVIHGCLKGDIDLDDTLTCADLNAAKSAIGARRGDARYVARADFDDSGVIDIRDISSIARQVPAGTTCP